MEVTKDRLYFFIEGLRRNGLNAQKIHDFVNTAFPDNPLSVSRIRALCQEFREGRMTVMRKEGSGRRKSETRLANMEDVQRLINENPSVTIQQIADHLNISHSMAQRIVEDDIEVMWLHTKWVPHTLSINNKAVRVERCQELLEVLPSRQSRANLVTVDEKFFYVRKLKPSNKIGSWVTPFGDGKQLQTAKRCNMEKKFLVAMAISQTGTHYYEILQCNESINSERYIQFLKNMEAFYRVQQQPILPENMRLQQDNARPHVARATIGYIEERNIRLLRQPPYSPDVNLCDRHVFPRLEALRPDFASSDDIARFLDEQLPAFTQQRMNKALTSMMEHMERIIENDGSYVL